MDKSVILITGALTGIGRAAAVAATDPVRAAEICSAPG